MSAKISFTLDGQTLEAADGETIWQCAERAGIDTEPARGVHAEQDLIC